MRVERTLEPIMDDEEPRLGPEDAEFTNLAALLLPLASPVRLKLLRFLTRPHYLEEIASHLGVSRQAARKHVEKLVEIEVLVRRSGERETGPVNDYIINPRALFRAYDEFEKLGSLEPDESSDALVRTVHAGRLPEPAAADGPCFFIVRGFATGRRLPLHRDPAKDWSIGRDERADLVVDYDPFASNRHAEVRWTGRAFVLTDLRATNGTTHNWRPVPRGGEVPLKHGDLVGVGKTLLLFWDAR